MILFFLFNIVAEAQSNYTSQIKINSNRIRVFDSAVIDFDFKDISKQFPTEKLLIIGNPPCIYPIVQTKHLIIFEQFKIHGR